MCIYYNKVARANSSVSDMYVATIEREITDDTFLSEEPLAIYKSGNFNKVPYYLGTVAFEGNIVGARK